MASPNGSSDDPYTIHGTSPRPEERPRVLKHGDTFAVFDELGDLSVAGLSQEGIFHEGTRYLARFGMRIGGRRPLLLGSMVTKDDALLAVDLTNPDLGDVGRVVLPQDTVHVFRSSFLWDGACYARFRVRSFAFEPVTLSLDLELGTDYADIFEVRGNRRPFRGEDLPPDVGEDWILLAYRGLDGVERRTRIELAPRPDALAPSFARFELELPPRADRVVHATIRCDPDPSAPSLSYDEAFRAAAEERDRARSGRALLSSSNGSLDAWIGRSTSDLYTMITWTEHGPYPFAGIPWFSTPFGRDGIWTALETLWLDPDIATGVLAYLAATQAEEEDDERDAQPGKILHETRGGEMAALGEIPFGLYYGSADATPLFVVLAGATWRRTGDLELARRFWPNVERALEWIDRHADVDGDGFVEYARRAEHGLVSQGWKDSHDAIFHADGRLAEPPVALSEVQAYAFAARVEAAGLADALGLGARAGSLREEAERLRERFEATFWCEELGTYALALDGAKRPCRVRSSNAGHCLWTGIASPERARRVAETLLDEASFTGFGVRTVASTESRYNPMSYHDGSVWPHDSAIVAAGLARYGEKDGAVAILSGLLDASVSLDLHRMPELFCGFQRRPGEGPTLYPLACAPQSWSAAAVFLLLESALGLTIDAPRRELRFDRPILPEAVERLEVKNLSVAGATLDLVLERHPHDVGISIERREGDVAVIVSK